MPRDRGDRWKELGARIREARKQAGLTQRELGELVGVSSHAVWAWEAGRMRPRYERLVELAFHCETSPGRLLGQAAVETELLEAAEAAFRDAVVGLPPEDVESIYKFIRFVRAEHRERLRDKR